MKIDRLVVDAVAAVDYLNPARLAPPYFDDVNHLVLPLPVLGTSVSNDSMSYSSSSHAADGNLLFRRQYEMRAFSVAPSMLPELNRASSKIDAGERASAVFTEKQQERAPAQRQDSNLRPPD